jgi:2-keto-4-pentenoate hydratase
MKGVEVTLLQEDAATIADRFLSARRAAGGLSAYPGEFPASLDQAYAIQNQAIAGWERPVIGWKVGRIAGPLAGRLGADRLTGPIFFGERAERSGEGPAMPVFTGGFAAAEAEFLLRIGETPPPGKTSFSLDEAAGLIDAVHIGIEIASSPLRSINALGPIAVISDFGNNNGLVIGPALSDWRSSGFESWDVTTMIDGAVAGSGRASSFTDGAIGSARFLFELMARRGIALSPGQWISSGAVSGVHEARAGQQIEARFGEQLVVRCRLVKAEPQ